MPISLTTNNSSRMSPVSQSHGTTIHHITAGDRSPQDYISQSYGSPTNGM